MISMDNVPMSVDWAEFFLAIVCFLLQKGDNFLIMYSADNDKLIHT